MKKQRENVIKFPAPATAAPRATEFVIRDDVPIPPPRAVRRRWPMAGLAVNQSFTAPIGDRDKIQGAINSLRRATGKKFTIRQLDDFTIGIWRVE
jgi:hypothetical protein